MVEKSWLKVCAGQPQAGPNMSQLRAWLPYMLIGIILILTRTDYLPLKAWLSSHGVISFKGILGYPQVSESVSLLYLPGAIPFILVAVATVLLHKMPADKAVQAWRDAAVTMKAAAVSLIAAAALVKIYQGSGVNPDLAAAVASGTAQNLPSMPLAMATATANVFGAIWPLCASFIGGLGAFISGSNTVSDMLFGLFQWEISGQLGLPRTVIIAAQATGGAMGNMICIHNIAAACAVAGISGREGDILKYTLRPFLFYGLVVGMITWMLIAVDDAKF